ncbi:HAD-IB family hydrolase [Actinotalea sp. M2MS4P-6]|uniref:HAD family hydrolase n=1 Tax=Actinotalea sp. M2MS4P-6 TaxID=2983762 RepID=UPI0021E36A60|nr:HAD-IB family hydrolase [Actinotalea sp. M2MS4P-6]MCV2394863.1 HAD-IB family hydrolase [Actinotalea sp. M2MS4P-6]
MSDDGMNPDAAGPPAPSRVAAFFDLDNTLIRGASAFHLAVGLRARGLVRWRDLAEFAAAHTQYLLMGENAREIAHLRSRALRLVAGRSVAEMTGIGEEVWDEVLSLRLFDGTHALLAEHLDAGHQVWIVSASPIEIGGIIAARLGATGALGTVAEHVDGVYTGRLVGGMLHGSAKAVAVHHLADREGLDLPDCYAYGDSAHDVALLGTVGHPVAINPDGRLRRHARRAGWPVREFRGRGRVATRHGVHAASWAGAAWVLGVTARAVQRRLSGGPD